MNEYFFEFEVLDKEERKSSAVKFAAVRNYRDESVPVSVFVIIPAWNYGRINQQAPADLEPGLDQYESFEISHRVSGDEAPHRQRVTKEAYFDEANGFMAKLRVENGGDYTSFGQIVFFGRDNKPAESFHYALQFGARVKLCYTVSYGSGRAEFKIKHPPLLENVRLSARLHDKSVPIRTDSRYTERAAGEIKEGTTSTKLSVECEPGRQARLLMPDINQTGRYLLACESSLAPRPKRRSESAVHDVKCPYCFNEILPAKAERERLRRFARGVVSCDGRQDTDKETETNVRGKRLKRRLFCGNMHNENDSREREVLKYVLMPDKYEKSRNAVIGVLGTPSSGKTVYLSTLFNLMYAGREGDSSTVEKRTLISEDFLRSAFGSLPEGELKVYRQQTLIEKDGKLIADTRQWESAFAEHLGGMVLTAGNEIAAATNVNEGSKLSQRFHPFVFGVGKKGSAVFYDTAGEAAVGRTDADEKKRDGEPIIGNADYYILILNTESGRMRETAHILSNINRVVEEDFYLKPLAVVVAKFDKDEPNIVPDAACMRTDIADMIGGGSFEGSELERNIYAASDEIESYLNSTDGFETIRSELGRFKYKTYFNCSAIGDPDSIVTATVAKDKKTLKKQRLLYRLPPTRVELPAIWLLYQAGLIN